MSNNTETAATTATASTTSLTTAVICRLYQRTIGAGAKHCHQDTLFADMKELRALCNNSNNNSNGTTNLCQQQQASDWTAFAATLGDSVEQNTEDPQLWNLTEAGVKFAQRNCQFDVLTAITPLPTLAAACRRTVDRASLCSGGIRISLPTSVTGQKTNGSGNTLNNGNGSNNNINNTQSSSSGKSPINNAAIHVGATFVTNHSGNSGATSNNTSNNGFQLIQQLHQLQQQQFQPHQPPQQQQQQQPQQLFFHTPAPSPPPSLQQLPQQHQHLNHHQQHQQQQQAMMVPLPQNFALELARLSQAAEQSRATAEWSAAQIAQLRRQLAEEAASARHREAQLRNQMSLMADALIKMQSQVNDLQNQLKSATASTIALGSSPALSTQSSGAMAPPGKGIFLTIDDIEWTKM